jgi:hypothetical protein
MILLATLPVVKIPKIPNTKGRNISEEILPIMNPAKTMIRQISDITNLVDRKLSIIVTE